MWQWLAVLICVLLATTYVARAAWRTWHPKAGNCGGGGGCSAAKPDEPKVTLIPAEQLTLRRRR